MLKFTTAQVEKDSTSQPVWRPLREEAASPLFTTFSLQLIIFFLSPTSNDDFNHKKMTQLLLMSLVVQAIQFNISLSLFVFLLHNKLGGYSHGFSFFTLPYPH